MALTKFINRINDQDVFERSHEGLVVETYIRNWWDDWDDMAVIYNPETDSFDHVMVGTARGYCPGYADVDAPESLVNKYKESLAKAEQARVERERIENPGKFVAKGDLVEIVRGRKIKVGTKGQVFWVGDTKFGRSVGLEIDGQRVFTSVNNIKILDPQVNA